jgi:phosphatidylserine/phosphatidylglycerophosphate/cardiolipin synthase-like enzyme
MHNKFCVIDLKTVIHGSYNWTKKAQYNHETLEIVNSYENAEKYAEQFLKLKRVTINH